MEFFSFVGFDEVVVGSAYEMCYGFADFVDGCWVDADQKCAHVGVESGEYGLVAAAAEPKLCSASDVTALATRPVGDHAAPRHVQEAVPSPQPQVQPGCDSNVCSGAG